MQADELLKPEVLIPAIGHLSYALAAISFLLRDILLLRIVAIAAATANATFAFNGVAGPNWIPIFWQSLFILINTVWSIRLIRERRGVHFSEEERELYQTIFRNFSPLEFMKLLRIGQWQNHEVGDIVAKRGEDLTHVMLIYNGGAEVQQARGHRVLLKDGAFIGEMSFLQGGVATADVRINAPTKMIQWSKEALTDLLKRNPAMRASLTTVFGQDMAKKLIANDNTQVSEA